MCDCHRGDGSLSDEFTRNENTFLHALAHYYDLGFTYVELGDGDELWEHDNFRSIKRGHSDVFQAIKRFFDDDRFVLVWGNHNNYLRRRSYVEEHLYTYRDPKTRAVHDFFKGIEPCEALRLTHRDTGQEIVALHGHQGDFANDQAWFLAMLALRYFWRFFHAMGARNPISPAMNARKRDVIERDYLAWVSRHKRALICGHTHVFSYPRHDEPPYFNAGACVYPTSITAIEIADGEVMLVRWRVGANADGVLQVERQLMRGPEPLSRFDVR